MVFRLPLFMKLRRKNITLVFRIVTLLVPPPLTRMIGTRSLVCRMFWWCLIVLVQSSPLLRAMGRSLSLICRRLVAWVVLFLVSSLVVVRVFRIGVVFIPCRILLPLLIWLWVIVRLMVVCRIGRRVVVRGRLKMVVRLRPKTCRGRRIIFRVLVVTMVR